MSEYAVARLDEIEEVSDGREPWRPVRHHFGITSFGVNAWTGLGFLLAQSTWGAFPGHARNDIQSGHGVVHNSLLFDRPQKSVVRAPFYPFPRGLGHGQVSILPKPPWFVTNKQAREVLRKLTFFEASPSPLRLQHLQAVLDGSCFLYRV